MKGPIKRKEPGNPPPQSAQKPNNPSRTPSKHIVPFYVRVGDLARFLSAKVRSLKDRAEKKD